MLAAILALAAPAMAGGSLAGQVGVERHHVFFPTFGSEGGCQKMYQAYVAAGGHSAYASTISGPQVEYFVCGAGINSGSQAAAEKRAMASCDAALKKYKVKLVGGCDIVASK